MSLELRAWQEDGDRSSTPQAGRSGGQDRERVVAGGRMACPRFVAWPGESGLAGRGEIVPVRQDGDAGPAVHDERHRPHDRRQPD